MRKKTSCGSFLDFFLFRINEWVVGRSCRSGVVTKIGSLGEATAKYF